MFIFFSIENVGNISEVKKEVNNNVCVDYNHESDESTNRYISDSIEAFSLKTISGQKKRQLFECEVCRNNYDSLDSLYYHKRADHSNNGNNNIDFEFGSNVSQQSTPTVESQLTLNVQKTSDGEFKPKSRRKMQIHMRSEYVCTYDGCRKDFRWNYCFKSISNVSIKNALKKWLN